MRTLTINARKAAIQKKNTQECDGMRKLNQQNTIFHYINDKNSFQLACFLIAVFSIGKDLRKVQILNPQFPLGNLTKVLQNTKPI